MLVDPEIRTHDKRPSVTSKQPTASSATKQVAPIKPHWSKQAIKHEIAVLSRLVSQLNFILHVDSHVLYPPEDCPWETALDVEQLSFLEESYLSVHTALTQLQRLKRTQQSPLVMPLASLDHALTSIEFGLLLHQLEAQFSIESTLTTSDILELLHSLRSKAAERIEALEEIRRIQADSSHS